MTDYRAPVDDMMFTLTSVCGLADIQTLPGCAEASPDLVHAILDEAGKLGTEVLAPLNAVGDKEGARIENGTVRTASGFPKAYQSFIDGGWNGMPFPDAVGGQDLPWLVTTAATEVWHAANMAFALCPMLTGSAVELLLSHASDDIKATYLPNLVAGTWTGTMNLTEPQAGSDLSQVRARAVPDGNAYRISGQKIFITYGDHDMAENIMHMVLARTPDAPEGVKGISLFVVPKFLVNEDGSLGDRNDLRAASLEHKLGIHASPTAVMLFGENDGAVGYLVGEENRGLEAMFTMMNNARLVVGLQGVSIAERAYQRARAYAAERIQGSGGTAAIIEHPDVKRMLLAMRAQTEAARTLAYWVAAQLDIAKRHDAPNKRAEAQGVVDLMTPVVKAWCTDIGVAVADLGVQVHGGMGYIEETGAAQHLRDARIAPIYEGTNGIQALDLVGRKVGRDQGRAMKALIARMRTSIAAMATKHARLSAAVDALDAATDHIVETYGETPETSAAVSVPYLRLAGITVSGWLMVIGYEAAQQMSGPDADFAARKIAAVRYIARFSLAEAPVLAQIVREAGAMVADCPVDHL